ncbi:MAG: hypothetical protein PVG44_08980 [Desulfobacterales bacterium]
MDTDPIKCPTCGHAVMKAADACAYCGAILSQTESDQQIDQPMTDAELQTETSTPLPPHHQVITDTDAIEVPKDNTEVPFEQPLSDSIDQILLKEPPLEENLPSEDVKADEDVVMSVADETAEHAASEEKGSLESTADAPRLIDEVPDIGDDSATGSSEKVDVLTSVPEALAELIPANTQLGDEKSASTENEKHEVVNSDPESEKTSIIPEEILELGSQESIKSEILEDEIVELADGNDSQPESIPFSLPDSDNAPIEAGPDLKVDVTESEIFPQDKKVDDDITVLAIEEPIEEAIVLTAADEVQIPKKVTPETATETDRAEESQKQKLTKLQAKANKLEKRAIAEAKTSKAPKEAQNDPQASKSQKAHVSAFTADDTPEIIISGLESNTKTLSLLKKYEGQSIGINYDNSADIREAELVEVNNEFFSVHVESKEMKYSYPLKTLLTVIEGNDGVEIGETEPKARFNAVIKVYPLVHF